jgi:hypothetical protein
MIQNNDTERAILKVLKTILSCYTSQQLNVAERMIFQLEKRFISFPGFDKDTTGTLIQVLNNRKSYLIT